MNYIGKKFDYKLANGEIRHAVCVKIEHSELLNEPIYMGVSTYGNEVHLTKSEINKFYA